MEGSTSNNNAPAGLTARVLPAVYLFTILVIAGVIVGHAVVTAFYHSTALGWVDALAVPIVIAGCLAYKAHLRALEEHTPEEYLENLRKGFPAYVIYFIAVASLAGGLVTGGIYAVDNAYGSKAEEEANAAIASRKTPVKLLHKEKPKLAATGDKKASIAVSNPIVSGVQAPNLNLKSIIGESTRRTALINNVVLGEGQSSSIKVDGVSYQMKCLRIEDAKVTLLIEGLTNQIVLSL
jgi:hypothetical protein